MKPDASGTDSAFRVAGMDILSKVLSRADSPGDLGRYLTEKVRDLTSAPYPHWSGRTPVNTRSHTCHNGSAFKSEHTLLPVLAQRETDYAQRNP